MELLDDGCDTSRVCLKVFRNGGNPYAMGSYHYAADKEGLNFRFNVFAYLKDQMTPKSTGPYTLIL